MLQYSLLFLGTSEGMARECATEISSSMNIQVLPLDAIADGRLAGSPCVIIITSTYNGCPPSNSKHFDEWITSQKSPRLLKKTKFAVFGVGSSSWRTFHAFSKKMYKRFIELGAKPLTEYAGGDVNTNCKDNFAIWKMKLKVLLMDGITITENRPKSSIVIEGNV